MAEQDDPERAAGSRVPRFEKNGLRVGERVVCIDVPRILGTVIRCAEDGVDVRWDDGTLGEAIWDQTVAYNAYRFQVVRQAGSRVPSPPAGCPTRLVELARERARQLHTVGVAGMNTQLTTGHRWKGGGDIYSGFNDCPHPDCVLLRAAVVASSEGEDRG